MSLDRTTRKVVYQGDGKTTVFPFAFKVFAPSDIAVAVGTPNENSRSLTYGSDYTVKLNADQEENPGGAVTVAEAPASGLNLAVVSAIPALQPMVLTPYDGFNPETLNDDSDRHVALIQQLEERVGRCVSVDATDTKSADEFRAELLNLAVHAEEWADTSAKSAAEAKAYAEEIKAKLDTIDDLTDEQKAKIIAETENQLERIKAAAGGALTEDGVSCNEIDWEVTEEVPAETTVTFPQGFSYIAGRHHLLLWYDGVELTKDENFSEVGNEDQRSYTFIPHFPLAAGSHMHAWTAALGRGDETQLYSELYDLRSALADLSSRVVYKSEQAADDSSSSSSTSGS